MVPPRGGGDGTQQLDPLYPSVYSKRSMPASPRTFLRVIAALLGTALLAACNQPQPRGPVVLAASSMADAMGAVAADWAAQGHAPPVLSFAGTPALARQIAAGAPADLVITADAAWMDWLAGQGAIDRASRCAVAGNALVYIAPAAAHPAAQVAGDAVPLEAGRLAIGDPASVPAGRYARAALEAAGLWDSVADRIVPAENVRAALALVERGEAPLGVVYASDAQASDAVVALPFPHPLPDGMTITYPAARLAGAQHPDAAALLAYLASGEAAAILQAHGFTPPSGADAC